MPIPPKGFHVWKVGDEAYMLRHWSMAKPTGGPVGLYEVAEYLDMELKDPFSAVLALTGSFYPEVSDDFIFHCFGSLEKGKDEYQRRLAANPSFAATGVLKDSPSQNATEIESLLDQLLED